jgi:hypothetical protein
LATQATGSAGADAGVGPGRTAVPGALVPEAAVPSGDADEVPAEADFVAVEEPPEQPASSAVRTATEASAAARDTGEGRLRRVDIDMTLVAGVERNNTIRN